MKNLLIVKFSNTDFKDPGVILKLKRDHHSLRDGLANVFKRTSRRWPAMRANGMTTTHPAGKQAATPQSIAVYSNAKAAVKEKSRQFCLDR
jgi:hypothetical protein